MKICYDHGIPIKLPFKCLCLFPLIIAAGSFAQESFFLQWLLVTAGTYDWPDYWEKVTAECFTYN